MASSPPFELEDQTDEDFFDKLVDDDDISGGGFKITGLTKAPDISYDDESDEAKTFANLTISEGGNLNEVPEAIRVSEEDVNVGEEMVEVMEPKQSVSDANREAVDSLMSPSILSLDNGHAPENGFVASNAELALRSETSSSVAGGVKEVQWSNFSNSDELGDAMLASYSDFFTDLGEGGVENLGDKAISASGYEAVENTPTTSSYINAEYQVENEAIAGQSSNGADMYSSQNWENLYPGWKYDSNTGQWYQLDACVDTTNAPENIASAPGNVQGNPDAGGDNHRGIFDAQASQASFALQSAQSSVGTLTLFSTIENVSGWNYASQQNGEYQYPAHMFFDPQYPGWYYDTIAQDWRSLEAYHSSADSMNQIPVQQAQNGFLPVADYCYDDSQRTNSGAMQGMSSRDLNQGWATSFGDHDQQGTNINESEAVTGSTSGVSSSGGQSFQNSSDFFGYSHSPMGQQKPFDSRGIIKSYDAANQSSNASHWAGGLQSSVPTGNTCQQFNHTPQREQNGQGQYSNAYYVIQRASGVSQPSFPNGHYAPYASSEGSSSAGRPPHALVTFGFGGKLVVMRDNSTGGSLSLGSKDRDGHLISVLHLMEVVSMKNAPTSFGAGPCAYFRSLCQQSFPGPLVGGSAGSKELHKWIDEMTPTCDTLNINCSKGDTLKLLLSLLKIAYQEKGKLRSSGVDTGLIEKDLPETAVAKLLTSTKTHGGEFSGDSAIGKCFINLPSEAQIQRTAAEVQNLLMCGRKKEALQCAQEGQFWGFALILGKELGDQFYADIVRQMAVSQLVVGSPLRTLCLLIAKKPEEVFSANVMAIGNMPGAVHMSPQSAQTVGYSMLDNWEENLAAVTSNRTENDHLVIIHLGDCLWKEKNDVTAAHICYLVAEADFELYSDSARLRLIGADHWNYPRTYASPEAIQRTEFFEYSKVLGNSQFVLLQLQPYKLIYAHMLAEVGKVSESLKYCQAVHKSLKTGRSPEAETLKQLLASLEERIRTHQQSGYAVNPAKIMGRLLTLFDSTAHRVVGGLPPVPSTQSTIQGSEIDLQTFGPKESSSQSTMGTSTLMPSASMEPISQWAVDKSRMTMQNRSISEPDIGRIPKPTDSSNEATSSSSEEKPPGTTGKSRFGRLNFGAQILQKTVGLVLKPRQGRQAKLGETNKFYYDEKLKRWVEEGAELPAEETALPPPPTTATFQSGTSDYNSNSALDNGLHATNHRPDSTSSTPFGSSAGIPAIPPSSNQFSARGRMGVRSRYVDTFNKGSAASTNLFQAPSVPSAKPASAATAKFFIPTVASTTVGTEDTNDEVENSSLSMNDDALQNMALSPAGAMQRFPSVDDIPRKGTLESGFTSLASQSRRTASWSEIRRDTPKATLETKASPLSFMPSHHLPASLPMNGGGNLEDDLQEVEL